MKKIFMIACMMLMSTAMFAQAGKMAIGGNLSIGFYDHYNPLGIGPKFQWEFIDNMRLDASAGLYTKKNGFGIWDINVNYQYLFDIASQMKLYPLGGLTLVGTTGDGDSETCLGFNLGGGYEYNIKSNLRLTAEMKYQYAKKSKHGFDVGIDGLVISAGLLYVF